MAIYDLNNHELKSLLQHNVSPGTENAIINALSQQNYYKWSGGDPIVETVTAPAYVPVPHDVQLVLDVGGAGTLTITDHGKTVIASGDGNVNIDDKGPGGDSLVGGDGANYLRVHSGNNVLYAGAGHETLYGGSGNDTMYGGGHSSLVAGTGNDWIQGGFYARAHDSLYGGSGNDVLKVSEGNNLLVAGSGHSTIYGGSGKDTIYGGGHDTIKLGTGATDVIGGSGAGNTDSVYAGLKGNDSIFGGTATTVYSAQSEHNITSDKVVGGVTVITFSDKQVLHVQGATIDFKGGGTQNT